MRLDVWRRRAETWRIGNRGSWPRAAIDASLREAGETVERLCAEVERLRTIDRQTQRVRSAARALVRALDDDDRGQT